MQSNNVTFETTYWLSRTSEQLILDITELRLDWWNVPYLTFQEKCYFYHIFAQFLKIIAIKNDLWVIQSHWRIYYRITDFFIWRKIHKFICCRHLTKSMPLHLLKVTKTFQAIKYLCKCLFTAAEQNWIFICWSGSTMSTSEYLYKCDHKAWPLLFAFSPLTWHIDLL